MIKITKKDLEKGKHNPEKTLSERLAPVAAIALLIVIILTLFI